MDRILISDTKMKKSCRYTADSGANWCAVHASNQAMYVKDALFILVVYLSVSVNVSESSTA